MQDKILLFLLIIFLIQNQDLNWKVFLEQWLFEQHYKQTKIDLKIKQKRRSGSCLFKENKFKIGFIYY